MGYLSVDFGRRKIRLLETEGSAKKIKIKAFRAVDTFREGGDMFDDPSSMKIAADALKETLSKYRFTRDPSSMAIDTSSCIIRELSLPFKGEDQIRKVIKYESEGQIQHDIDDVVVDFFKRSETIDKSNLMVIAARKDLLKQQLAFLDGLSIDPLYVDVDILCLYNALSGTNYLKEHKCFVVIDVSRDATALLVIDRERLISCRSIPLGAGNIVQALEHDLSEERLDPHDSGVRLLGLTDERSFTVSAFSDGGAGAGEGRGPDGEEAAGEENPPATRAEKPREDDARHMEEMARKRRKDFLEKFRREIVRMFTFLEMAKAPEKVYLTGMGCRMPGLKEVTENLFRAEVAELDLLSRVEHGFSEKEAQAVNHEVGVALGVAFKQVGHDATRVDLRKEDVKYAKKFDQIKAPLAGLTFLLLLMTVLLNLELLRERQCKMNEMKLIYGYSLRELGIAVGDMKDAQRLVSAKPQNSREGVSLIKRALVSKNKKLLDALGRGGTIPELPSAFPVWRAVMDALVKNDDKIDIFKLDRLKIDTLPNPSMTMDGEVGSGNDMSTLLEILRTVPIFSDVKPGDTTGTASGNRKFTNLKAVIDFSRGGK